MIWNNTEIYVKQLKTSNVGLCSDSLKTIKTRLKAFLLSLYLFLLICYSLLSISEID